MLFYDALPEQAGVRSEDVYRFLSSIEKRGIHMHSLLLLRGDKIILDAYWKPFSPEMPHRMYSVTKSFVSVAVGLAEEDGFLDLDAPIASYFPDMTDASLHPWLAEQSVRQMLTMTTVGPPSSWFLAKATDRTAYYFAKRPIRRPAGTLWEYDSDGSQVLSALVERQTGKRLFDYLNERVFQKLGAFQNAKILKTPNGDSWGDSALICTPRDLAAFARFVMNYGVVNGERLLNEDYLRTATSPLVHNATGGHGEVHRQGYGYQFWCTEGEGFAFVGMGDQLAVCFPKQDLLMVCTADNQGNPFPRGYLVSQLLDLVVERVSDTPLPQNPEAASQLRALSESLSLFAVRGREDSPLRENIDGVRYLCRENPLGWRSFSFRFEGEDAGTLSYENARGVMELPFFVNRNRFGRFPEKGYSHERGGVPGEEGHTYQDAVSLAFLGERELMLFVQITDEYFGNLSLDFAFRGPYAALRATKSAENFLLDYEGELVAERDESSVC